MRSRTELMFQVVTVRSHESSMFSWPKCEAQSVSMLDRPRFAGYDTGVRTLVIQQETALRKATRVSSDTVCNRS